MAFEIALDDGLELTVSAVYDGQEIANVFWFRAAELPGGTDFPLATGSIETLSTFITAWRDNILPLLSNGYRVNQYVLRRLVFPFPGGTPKFNFSATEATVGDGVLDVGDAGNASLPSYATVNVWYQASPGGRSGRGRKAYGPITEDQTNNSGGFGNYLTDGNLTAWQEAIGWTDEDLTTGVTSDNYAMRPVVASLKSYVAGSGLNNVLRVISGSTVRQALGSQVSRKRKNSGA